MSAPDTRLTAGTIAPETKLTAQTNPESVSLDSSMTFHTGSREVLRITNEARLVIGEGLSKDEATQETAKLLVAAFEERIQKMLDKRIADLKSELEKIVLIAGLKADSNVELRMRAEKAEAELAAMIARVEKAEADTKRLDWMEKYDWSNGFGDEVLYVLIQHRIWNGYELPSLRAAIDAAMKETQK